MNIARATEALTNIACDLLVLGVPATKDPANDLEQALSGLGTLLAKDIADTLVEDEFKGKAGETHTLPTYGRIPATRVLIVGLGEGGTEDVRIAAGQAAFTARDRGAQDVVLDLGDMDSTAANAAMIGFGIGNYRFDRYKPEDDRKARTEALRFIGDVDLSEIEIARAIVGGQNLARDLVNEPAAAIYPETLAAQAASLAGDHLTVDVWDEARMAKAGMGGILAVGQGSSRPPRLIHMHYKPAGTARKTLGLVGKGVTFDAGGLSLKPSDGMLTMRCDMAGGATVIGAMKAITAIAPDVEVHAVVGAVENMTGANCYKLGDILNMYNGKTVEVHNTDAEGRLVLADCLTFCEEQGVDAIVDFATLTGACVVALGDAYTGLFTADDAVASGLLSAAEGSGDGLWRMPLPDTYKEYLKAEWGELKNLGPRWGGAITAALFLSHFVEKTPWAHCDIAGPAFLDSRKKLYAKGATGAMVGAVVGWVQS